MIQEAAVSRDTRTAGLLEKKWTSVIRLQKKIADMEQRFGKPRSDPVVQSLIVLKDTPKAIFQGHSGSITMVAFHPEGFILATASEDATVRLWDLESGRLERVVKGHTRSVTNVIFNDSGSLMITSSADSMIKLWNTKKYECERTLYGHEDTVSGIDLIENLLVSVSRDNTIKIWDLKSGQCKQTVFGHEGWIRCVSVSANYLVTGGDDHSIIVWDVNTWTECGRLLGHEQAIESVQIAPENAGAIINARRAETLEGSRVYLASSSRDKTIKIWELQAHELIFTLDGHTNWVKDITFYQERCLISCSDDQNIKIWDLASGDCICTFPADEKFVTCVAVHPYKSIVASGAISKVAKVWSS